VSEPKVLSPCSLTAELPLDLSHGLRTEYIGRVPTSATFVVCTQRQIRCKQFPASPRAEMNRQADLRVLVNRFFLAPRQFVALVYNFPSFPFARLGFPPRRHLNIKSGAQSCGRFYSLPTFPQPPRYSRYFHFAPCPSPISKTWDHGIPPVGNSDAFDRERIIGEKVHFPPFSLFRCSEAPQKYTKAK